MKKNKLGEGLKTNKKVENSLYYFIIDNRIDWVIVFGSFFGLLPYIGSIYWYLIIIKSFILLFVVSFSIKYIFTWNKIRKAENTKNKIVNNFKNNTSKYSADTAGLIKELEKLSLEINDKLTESETNLKEKENRISEITKILESKEEVILVAFSKAMAAYVGLKYLRETPIMKRYNYIRLISILLLIIVFFIIYSIENSIT